jgi:hypothetical protein
VNLALVGVTDVATVNAVFWEVTQWSLIGTYRHFGGTSYSPSHPPDSC